MFVAFAKPIAAAIVLIASGPQIPRFDIEKMCRSTMEDHWDHATMHECRHEERAARDGLQRRWLKIPLSYREQCAGSADEVDPSYVELMTCIETDVELAKQNAGGSRDVTTPDSDDQ